MISVAILYYNWAWRQPHESDIECTVAPAAAAAWWHEFPRRLLQGRQGSH